MSPRTEESYRYWAKHYILFHGKRHPNELGAIAVEAFLNHLALERVVSASTQTQALNALVFLYRVVLGRELGELSGLHRIRRRFRVPVVLTREEVAACFAQMTGTPKLMAQLLYGAGLRVSECVQLRLQDVDFGAKRLSIRNAKGGKDRTTLLPESLASPLQLHLVRVIRLHREDLAKSAGFAPLPGALHRKYRSASRALAWQFVFPSSVQRIWPPSGELVRWHASESTVQRAFREAVLRAGLRKHASVHTLRHYAESRIMPSTSEHPWVRSACDSA